jgi:hypothetical protein
MDYVIGGQWFTSMQYFLHHCNAHLQFDTTRLPALLRANDRVLMDDFREHGLSPQELRLANNCRLYLQVECLSEICEEGGRSIARHAWSVDREAATALTLDAAMASSRQTGGESIESLAEVN